MLAKWNTIALSDNVNDFINFKNTYNDIQYGRLCDIKIDSLDFIIAQKQGTPEAYQHYLDSHPDGRYASEASIAQGTLRDQEVDEQDRQQICSVVTEFFNGFASLDDNRICSNIASTMDKFLKHSSVNKSNVLSTIHGMFNEHIQSNAIMKVRLLDNTNALQSLANKCLSHRLQWTKFRHNKIISNLLFILV